MILWWGGGADGIFCHGLTIKRRAGKGELEDKRGGGVWVGWEYRVLDRVVHNITHIHTRYRDFFYMMHHVYPWRVSLLPTTGHGI